MGETNSQILWILKSAGVTSLSRAESGTISVPEGLDGRLKKVIARIFGTLETVVNGGGKVEITNDSIAGMVCNFVLGGGTAVTEGGGHENNGHEIECDYPLEGGSTFTIFLTPYDDQDMTVEIELVYEKDGQPEEDKPNYIDANMRLKANAITQVTVHENHNQISIPSKKGGILVGYEVVVFPTLETIVNAGGKIVLSNTVESWKPFEAIMGGFTAVGASGGGVIMPQHRKTNKPCAGNSRIDLDFTPYDNQSESLGLTVMIRGKDPT